MEARTTCFNSFIRKIKRKTIYEARTLNSDDLETVKHIAQVIFVLHVAL